MSTLPLSFIPRTNLTGDVVINGIRVGGWAPAGDGSNLLCGNIRAYGGWYQTYAADEAGIRAKLSALARDGDAAPTEGRGAEGHPFPRRVAVPRLPTSRVSETIAPTPIVTAEQACAGIALNGFAARWSTILSLIDCLITDAGAGDSELDARTLEIVRHLLHYGAASDL